MSVFRKYVRNRFRPKGCMVQGWLTGEAIEFCTHYLDISRVGVPVSCHEGRLQGRGKIGEKSVLVDDLVAFKQAHFTVLQQATIVSPHHTSSSAWCGLSKKVCKCSVANYQQATPMSPLIGF